MQGEFGAPITATATGIIYKDQGQLIGFYCNSTTTGTLILYDAATAVTTTPISGTITPTAGTFNRFPAGLTTGLYAVIGGAALSVTFFVI